MAFYTDLLASRRNGTLYVGSTENLSRRVWEHQEHVRQGFTALYGVHRLVWFEVHASRDGAFVRERRIKKWRRLWKLQLIEGSNPSWRDLVWELVGAAPPSEAAHPRESGDERESARRSPAGRGRAARRTRGRSGRRGQGRRRSARECGRR